MATAESITRALAPDLPMYLVDVDAESPVALYAGLWSTWWVNETNQAAKICLATVLRDPQRAVPTGPLALLDLTPWVVLQLHSINEESPAWERLRQVLDPEFSRSAQELQLAEGERKLMPDSSQSNHATRQVRDPKRLAAMAVVQRNHGNTGNGGGQLSRPIDTLDRRRVEYTLPNNAQLRLFVEKATTKQPIQREMEAEAGLVRNGTVLGAIHEWHTWFVVVGT